MPSRPFAGSQTLSGSAQPAFGTTTTAAVIPTYDRFAGNVTGANPSMTTLSVTSTAGFRAGDYVLVCTQYPVNGPPNMGQIKSFPTTTSMVVQGLTQSVSSGAFVVLAVPAESITIQDLTAGSMYVGTASTISSTDASLLAELFTGGVYSTPTTDISHAYNTVDYWVEGASGTFVASYSQG